MQVKKFEARTMQEALEMVKTELGPQAIILSAKDNNRRFGLVGEGSVEITAAISEESLRMKKYAESRLKDDDKTKLQRAPARQQQKVIEKIVTDYIQAKTPTKAPEKQTGKPLTSQRYIDIQDEESANVYVNDAGYAQAMATQRIKSAAVRAKQAMFTEAQDQRLKSSPSVSANVEAPKDAELKNLRAEIEDLRSIIQQFKDIPQSFVGQHPGADYGLPFDVSFMFEKLTAAGILKEYAAEILTSAVESLPAPHLKKKSSIEAFVAKHILNHIETTEQKPVGKVHLFLGASGHGKTSSLVKMAAHFVVAEKKRIAILTADTIKVGAAEQLRTYAQILNVPFAVLRSTGEWTKLESQLAQFDHVLVDYPGFSLRTLEELNYLKAFQPPGNIKADVHLVMSATAKDQDAFELARRYDSINYTDVIFTALDESAQHGVIYNFQRKFGRPLHSFGIGPRVPEDFEPATRERVLDLIFKITRLKSATERES